MRWQWWFFILHLFTWRCALYFFLIAGHARSREVIEDEWYGGVLVFLPNEKDRDLNER